MIEPKHRPADSDGFLIHTKTSISDIACAEVVLGDHWVRCVDKNNKLIAAFPAHDVTGVVAHPILFEQPGSVTVTGTNDGKPTDS